MNGNVLEIGDEKFGVPEALNFSYRNPFINREANRTFGSSGFGMPATPALLKCLSHPQLLQKTGRVFRHADVNLYSDGQKVFRGILYTTDIDTNLNNRGTEIQCSIADERNNFAAKVKGLKLNSLHMGGPIIITNSDEEYDTADFIAPGWTDVCNTPTADWVEDVINNGHELVCFPSIWNDHELCIDGSYYTGPICNFWDTNTNALLKMDATKAFNAYVEYVSSSGEGMRTHTITNYVPCFYYKKVLEHCFSEHGYTLEGDILTEELIDDMILISTHNIVKPRFLGIAFVGNSTPTFRRYDELTTQILAYDHLPDCDILDFIQDFMLSYNCAIDIIGTRAIIRKFRGTVASDAIEEVGPDVNIQQQETQPATLAYDWDSREEHEQYDDLRGTTVKASSLPDVLEYDDTTTEADGSNIAVRTYNKITRVKIGVAEEENEFIDNLIPYTNGDARVLTSKVFPVCMARKAYGSSPMKQTYLPVINRPVFGMVWQVTDYRQWVEEGEIELIWDGIGYYYFDTNDGDKPPTKAFYHGMHRTLDTFIYPYASSHNYKQYLSTQLGTYHMGWLGSEGQVETFWSTLLPVFDSTSLVRFRAKMSLQQVLRFPFQHFHVIRGRKYFVANLMFKLPLRDDVIIECWEMP